MSNEDSLKLFCSLYKHRQGGNVPSIINIRHVYNCFRLLYDKFKDENLRKIFKPDTLAAAAATRLPPQSYRAALLIPSDCLYNQEFFEKYSENYFLGYNPEEGSEGNLDIHIINQSIINKFPKWYDSYEKFYNNNQNLDKNIINFKNETILGGFWKNTFNDDNYYDLPFFNKCQNNPITMKMMKLQNTFLKSHYNARIHGTFIDLPFTNGYSMLIFLPDSVLEDDKLIEVIRSDPNLFAHDLINFYETDFKFIEYSEFYLPKFNLKSEYYINEHLFDDDDDDDIIHSYINSSSYLKELYSNISQNLNGSKVLLSFYSTFICNAFGNKPFSINQYFDDDDDDDDDDDNKKTYRKKFDLLNFDNSNDSNLRKKN